MVNGVGKSVKYAMFLANGFIFIGGLIVFAIGVWTLADRSFMERLLGSSLYAASAWLLLVSGAVVAIISFLGSFGAYKENRCSLLLYVSILLFIFLLMLSGGIVGYLFRSKFDDRTHREMEATVSQYKNDSIVTDAWDSVQINFRCCGVSANGAKGWSIWQTRNRPQFGMGVGRPKVPLSCCVTRRDVTAQQTCVLEPSNPQNVFQDDCYVVMKDFVKGHALLLGGFGIGIACLLIIGIILAMVLFMRI